MQNDASQPKSNLMAQVPEETYLLDLQALAAEVDQAMNAMTAKELPRLQESLTKQRSICARLLDHQRSSDGETSSSVYVSRVPIDADLKTRIAAAAADLNGLNMRYAALLRHSGDTLRMFAGLVPGYPGTTKQVAAAPTSLHVWSCEL